MRLPRLFPTLALAVVLAAGGVRVSSAPARQAATAALSDGIARVTPESVGFSTRMRRAPSSTRR